MLIAAAKRAWAGARRRQTRIALVALALLPVGAISLPARTAAEQASQPTSAAAAQIDASGGTSGDVSGHTCAVPAGGGLRCWGFGGNGRLGYANTSTIGDDEAPGSVGPVDLGSGRTVRAISAGAFHTCAVLDDNTVRCWGFGGEGRLGYANTNDIGDDEAPATTGAVDLGEGRTARAITAGGAHTCALLDDDTVRCWGFGGDGRLGYAGEAMIGDNETPGSAGPVDLGAGRTARAISAGDGHTCAVLDDGSVRCWGFGNHGRLGYAGEESIGDNETPGSAGPVELGAGRTARAISAGDSHTCALLDDYTVRCWGFGANGRLGYADTADVGDDEPPGAVGPVDLGAGRTARAISAGGRHTCALLDDAGVRCWGYGVMGRLGYCNVSDIGDDETPGSVGPVNVSGSSGCTGGGDGGGGGGSDGGAPGASLPTPGSKAGATRPPVIRDTLAERYRRALAAQMRRKRALRRCLRSAKPHPASPRRKAARQRCMRRHGRTPGSVRQLTARAIGRTKIVLSFRAPGTDGRRAPAARRYIIKQSTTPIRGSRGFRRAQALCSGRCSVDVTVVGAPVTLTITHLLPGTTYYYAVAALDNVSGRRGPRSRIARAKSLGRGPAAR